MAKLTASLKEINFKNSDYIILPCFLFPVLFGVFWPAYLIALAHILFKFNLEFFKKEKFSVLLVGFFFALKFLQWPSIETIIFLKTFAGFYFFYIYFRYFNKANFEKIIISCTSIYIFIEWIYKIFTNKEQFGRRFYAIAYPRPLGLAENATIMTSILIIYLLIFSTKLKKRWSGFLIFDVSVSSSGLGFLGLMYYFLFSKFNWILKNKVKTILFFSIVFFIYIFAFQYLSSQIYSGNPLYKISPKYVYFLFKNKLELIANSRSTLNNWYLFLFGLPWNGNFQNLGGDFGWLDIFLMSGFIGIVINLFLLDKIVKDKWIKFFLILSIFHYSSIWWPAGQIYLGFVFGHIEKNQ